MVDRIYQLLKPLGHPCQYILRPNLDRGVSISYHFFNRSRALRGDGKGRGFTQSVQIDVFYNRDIGSLADDIIDIMEAAGFLFSREDDDAEIVGGVRLYHKILVFNFLESEVINHGE